MARAGIVVEAKHSTGWQYYRGYPSSSEEMALFRAHILETHGTPVRVYRRTPDGPQVIYESPKS